MRTILPYDANGNLVNVLAQWDKDICIYLNDSEIDSAYYVHFYNKNSEESLTVESEYLSNNQLKVKIPNDLLALPYAITGCVFTNPNQYSEHKSILQFRIPITKKPKPSDYIHNDELDYVGITEIKKYIDAAKIDLEETVTGYMRRSNYIATDDEVVTALGL